MAQLAERLGNIMLELGYDPAARAQDLHALASLEERDARAAQERFHELKRALLLQRRADLLTGLRAHNFVRDLPPFDTKGYGAREVESEVRALSRALAAAREVARSLDEGAALAASATARAIPPSPDLAPQAWDALGPLVERAEAWRRAVAREARIEARAADAQRRARKLRELTVDAPAKAGATDEALEAIERALSDAEALEGAHDDVLTPLRDAAVRERRASSRRTLEREALAALRARDAAALSQLRVRAEALRREAAREAEEAAKARRTGRAPPERERRSGDPLDPYA